MHEVNILYCFDSRFSKLAAVSIYSLLKHKNAKSAYHIYIMCPPHTREKSRINKIAARFQTPITWHIVRDTPFKNHDYMHWSPTIFYRLIAPATFPNVEKMLYLDCDTLIFHDLSELYETDISNYAIGAVADHATNWSMSNQMGAYVHNFSAEYMNTNPYINSGVLLMNMYQIHINHQKFLVANIPTKYPDQDLLNYVLWDKIKYLDSTYNFSWINLVDDKTIYNPSDYHIVHCCGAKPYMYQFVHKKLFGAFCALAAEINLTQEDFIRNDIKHATRRYSSRTSIPFLRLDKKGKLRLFGIRIA